MKKIVLFLLLGLICLGANNAFAHTSLKSSSPSDGETVKEELTQINLTFETKIDKRSKLKLIDSTGNDVALKEIEISDNQLIGLLSSPLENSEYEARWEIIGADSHTIDGEFTFVVDAPAVDKKATAEDEVDHSQHSAAEHAAYLATHGPNTILVPAISILVIIIIAIIITGIIISRKNEKK